MKKKIIKEKPESGKMWVLHETSTKINVKIKQTVE